MLKIIFAFLLLPVLAQAAPKVVLFGAAYTTKAGMDACNSRIRNIPWAEAEATVPKLAAEINANPEQAYVIAGHSSAAAHAEHVALKVKNPDQIKLVLLDGYGHEGVQKKVHTTCWYGVDGRGGESLNAGTMKAVCKQARSHIETYKAPHCAGLWCLHFALVNEAAPADLRAGTWARRGYENCRGNAKWTNP